MHALVLSGRPLLLCPCPLGYLDFFPNDVAVLECGGANDFVHSCRQNLKIQSLTVQLESAKQDIAKAVIANDAWAEYIDHLDALNTSLQDELEHAEDAINQRLHEIEVEVEVLVGGLQDTLTTEAGTLRRRYDAQDHRLERIINIADCQSSMLWCYWGLLLILLPWFAANWA
ncbi:hypothetical protein B0H10DRAFT_1958508 [Mycena sp. CBHHK59/15]|nr:hypothetical protein B0H10DRAFT_1958508 [Mycena sp. CBHHK59/15]